MSDGPKATIFVRLGVSAAGLAVFALVTALAGSDLGAAAAFAFIAIVVAAYATTQLRRRAFYWPTLGLFSVAHVAALIWWHPLIPSPAVKVAPLVVIDFVVMVLVLFALERGSVHHGD